MREALANLSDPCTSSLYCPPSSLVPVTRELAGHTYTFLQFWQLFPWSEPFYTRLEKEFDVRPWFLFVHANGWLPVVSIILYAAMVLLLPPITSKRPVKCDTALAYWNLLLAAFSILGALRIVPHLLWFLTTHSFKETVCTPPERMNGDGASGLWCLLFTLSKLVELVDTMFVCLKGRKPIFLHWYHHVTVLSFTWAAYAARHPGMYFIAMNYTVHAVMYSYYFLMAIKAKPKWLNPIYITFLQIFQMVAGVIITVYGFIYARDPSTCGVVPSVLYFQSIIYGSYLYLFLEFLVKRFFCPPQSVPPASRPVGKEEQGREEEWKTATTNGAGTHLKKAQ